MVTVGRKKVSQASTAKSATDTARVQSESSHIDLSKAKRTAQNHIDLSKAKRTAQNLNPLARVAKFLNGRILFRDIDFQQQQFIKGTFTYKQLKIVTRNFHIDNRIGEGGFGQVYKGVLPNGTVIAVKLLSSKAKQASSEFMNEVGMISAVSHPHLVKLLGCCNENNRFLLVYEYMENNSLSNALFGSWNLKSKLKWENRFNICLGIAKGLTYLHEESRLKFIHRDIKPSNILLDKYLNAKISDFGLAKFDGGENGEYSTNMNIITPVAGTNGYMAPEYAMRGVLTTKADVYSFGVVMLELFSGKRSMDYSAKKETVVLLDLAYVLQKKGKLLDLIDPDLNMTSYPKKTALMLLELAMLCTDPSPTPRPNMSEVVSILEGKAKMKSIQLPARYMHDFQKVNVLADAFISPHSGSHNPRDGTTNPLYTSGKGSATKLNNKHVQEPPVLQLNDNSDEGADVNDDESISRAAEGGGNINDVKLLIKENASITKESPESPNAGKSSTNGVRYMDYAGTKMGEDNKTNKLEYVEPCFEEDGKLHIECSEEDFETRCNEWKDSLVGFFVGDKTPSFDVLDKEKIENLWGLKRDSVSVFSMKNGYVLFRFKHVVDKLNVLESGPWHIEHRHLVLMEWNWKLEFEHKADDEIKTLPIWVKIYDLPLIFWSGSFFSKVASSLGIPLYVDQKTKNKERLDYARICIEVNANKPLAESLNISFKGVQCEIKFKYDWKPLRCATCCTFGHEESDCESKTKTQ